MKPETQTPSLIIDPQALKHNLDIVRSFAPASKILAVVKANAYGHGLEVCYKALRDADGFAVARLQEAVELRQLEKHKPIVIFSEAWQSHHPEVLAKLGLSPVLYQAEQLDLFKGHPLHYWINLDTGMHRSGLLTEEFSSSQTKEFIEQHQCTLMTHFAESENADTDFTETQINQFKHLTQNLSCKSSMANSAAIIQHPGSHTDWVRPGIMLYGSNPVRHMPCDIKAVMQLNAHVISVRDIAAGESVGYNRRWSAPVASRIANINIGYADGYPRHAPNGTPVWINGKIYPLVGTVSMDSLSVDVTGSDITTGDSVELWGPNLPVDTIADSCNSISYQLFCNINSRVNRSVSR